MILFFTFFLFSSLQAQEKRASPLIMLEEQIENTTIKLTYGQPSMKDREIFGKLVPYGQVWRTGANEATIIEFSTDVLLNGQKVLAGKYALFSIPGEENWTIILNSIWNQWGAYTYDQEKDVIRFEVETKNLKRSIEKFTIKLDKNQYLGLCWSTIKVDFKIEVIK